jgi:hypothetical protein
MPVELTRLSRLYSASDTTSLKSEITAYRYENGRRYHSYREGAYWYVLHEITNWMLPCYIG